MNDVAGAFLTGVLCGVVIIGALCKVVPSSAVQQYRTAIEQCEAKLPRNQHCKVIGVPITNEQSTSERQN